jgi:hypothetical protein
VCLGDVAYFGDRGDVAIRRIDGFKRDELWRIRVEVGRIVVGKHPRLRAALPDPFDHRGVV